MTLLIHESMNKDHIQQRDIWTYHTSNLFFYASNSSVEDHGRYTSHSFCNTILRYFVCHTCYIKISMDLIRNISFIFNTCYHHHTDIVIPTLITHQSYCIITCQRELPYWPWVLLSAGVSLTTTALLFSYTFVHFFLYTWLNNSLLISVLPECRDRCTRVKIEGRKRERGGWWRMSERKVGERGKVSEGGEYTIRLL